MAVVFILLWCGVGGIIGYAIGNSKGRGVEGFWLGLLLGVIGWIIVAFQHPSDEVAARQQAAATVLDSQVREVEMREQRRPCPWCAELIQPAARVCRYCGRDVDPVPPPTPAEQLKAEHQAAYDRAKAVYDGLPEKPASPVEWLTELCRRIEAGSPPDAAAARIPLDWTQEKPRQGSTSKTELKAFPLVASEHPGVYEEARHVMAGLPTQPHNPGSWLRELCTRMEAGSPVAAAASQIPLDMP
jgi:hypothetical protein